MRIRSRSLVLLLAVSAACSATGPAGPPGTSTLVRYRSELAGSNCTIGGTAVESGPDRNANGQLDDGEVTSTQYVCAEVPFATGWAVSNSGRETGNLPVGLWLPAGRSVSLYKVSDATRLKVTVSDVFRTSHLVTGGSGTFEVRMNGGVMNPACSQNRELTNSGGYTTGDFHHPFATVCVTDPLPAGLYEFEVWIFATKGWADLGLNAGQPTLLAEELPDDGSYAVAIPDAGSDFNFSTADAAYSKASFRALTYTKKADSTLLKVTLADTLRTGLNVNGGSGMLAIRMDGNDVSCSLAQYDAQGTGADLHEPFVLTCVLAEAAAGEHAFAVWLRSGTAIPATGTAHLGWNRSYPLLLVEELPAAGRSYVAPHVDSGDQTSEAFAEVGSRSLTHVVPADGTSVKLTYSDGFVAAGSCTGSWGFLKVYLDGQPTSCSLGQYATLNGFAQDHRRHTNLTCVLQDLTAGPHTFKIYSSAPACGPNRFGWMTGQNLLLVEDLP